MRASGTFTVKLTPRAGDAYVDGKSLGRLTIDKVFEGDLSGTSVGQMLSAMSAVNGSAPDSRTDGLEWLHGHMQIIIEGGVHSYVF